MYTIILGISIQIFVFIFIIYIGHSIWIYLKDTYSTKKTKDLVNTQVYKYKQIISELQENNDSKVSVTKCIIDEKELESMDDILTNFMENELLESR
jgi:hypothetical protein